MVTTTSNSESCRDAANFSAHSPSADRRVVVKVVLRDQVVLDGEFGQEMTVNRAQRRDARIEAFAHTFQPGDLIVELRSQTVTNFGFAERADGPMFAPRLLPPVGETEGLATEENDGGGSGLPSEGLIETQQGSNFGSARTSAAELRERVRTGPTSSAHIFLGQTELGHPHFDEVDESLDALTGNSHSPHPTGRSAANRVAVSGARYPSRTSEGLNA